MNPCIKRLPTQFLFADRVATLPPLTEPEAEAEIQAARAEKQAFLASSKLNNGVTDLAS